MMIRYDVSARTVLAICSCGWRSEIHPDRTGARTEAAAHEARVHPGTTRVRNADQRYRLRHA